MTTNNTFLDLYKALEADFSAGKFIEAISYAGTTLRLTTGASIHTLLLGEELAETLVYYNHRALEHSIHQNEEVQRYKKLQLLAAA